MRRKNSLFFIIILLVILTIAFLTRYIMVSPFIVGLVVFLIIRRIKNNERASQEEEARKRENRYSETYRTENTGYADNAGYTSYTDNTINTIITCEYCGSRVDTSKHACCDRCGGSYWDNKEWIEIQRKRNNR